MKLPLKNIILISHLLVASCLLFCRDPISEKNREKRKARDNQNDRIISLLLIPYLPGPCKVNCGYYNVNSNEIPYGDYSLTVSGTSITAYPKTVSTIFANPVSLTEAINQKRIYKNKCDGEGKELDCSYARQITSHIELQVYLVGYNTFLKYDGDKQVEVYADTIYTLANPTNPPNIANSDIYLKLTSLLDSEFNTSLTLNSTNTSRYFEITYQNVRYSSKYSGSSISMNLTNVPTAGNTGLVTITSGTLKSSNSSSLESLSITGTMTAYRK